MTRTLAQTPDQQSQSGANIEQALRTLRNNFCDGLDERICRIETAWVSAKNGSMDMGEALSVVEFEAHRISGVAGSLGLKDVGTQAHELEARIMATSPKAVSDHDQAELDTQINGFLDLLEQELNEE
jgi:HPt (histidine-containing phosphotransfer) domain-containing protein